MAKNTGKTTTQKKDTMAKQQPTKKRGRPPKFKVNKETSEMVLQLAEEGGTQIEIADALHMSVETLVKLYGEELKIGKNRANLKARQTLYKKAVIEGDRVLLMFYCKTQLGMKEVNGVEVTNPDGSLTPLDVTINFVGHDDTQED